MATPEHRTHSEEWSHPHTFAATFLCQHTALHRQYTVACNGVQAHLGNTQPNKKHAMTGRVTLHGHVCRSLDSQVHAQGQALLCDSVVFTQTTHERKQVQIANSPQTCIHSRVV
jgi:hypothetical protein